MSSTSDGDTTAADAPSTSASRAADEPSTSATKANTGSTINRLALPACICVLVDYIGLATVMPALPHHLTNASLLAPDEVGLWTGFINSAQFVGVVIGCILWGRASDRVGPRKTLLATMAGDVVLFTSTGFATNPALLLALRLLVGAFSPLVPALTYIFEVVPTEKASFAATLYSYAVIVGLATGNASVVLYEYLGFQGLGILSGALAVGAFVQASLLLKHTPAAERPKSAGVGKALRSPNFLTQSTTAFCMGFFFLARDSMITVDCAQRFGLSAAQTGAVMLCSPLVFFCATWTVTAVTKRTGLQLAITIGTLANVLCCFIMSLPAAHGSLGGLIIAFVFSNAAFIFQHVPNQVRAKMIGHHQTTNGTGSITGSSRVLWSSGQAVGPAAVLALYAAFGPSAAWMCMGSVHAATLLLYLMLGVNLWRDPWPKAEDAVAVPAAVEVEIAAPAAEVSTSK